MLAKLLEWLFPCEEENMLVELVNGPHDGGRHVPGDAGNMYLELSHRPDQNTLTEVTSIYEWNGFKWYFRHLGKTRPFVGVHEGGKR